MTRSRFATAFALVSLLVASCGDSLTGPTDELDNNIELTPPASTPAVADTPDVSTPEDCEDDTVRVVEVNAGFTIEDLEEDPVLIEPFLDPQWLRATQACMIVDDINPPERCCPSADSTGRAISGGQSLQYQTTRDEVYTIGKTEDIRAFPFLLLTDEEGVVLYVQFRTLYFLRPYPYPSDIPMYFWPLRNRPEEVTRVALMCAGGVHRLARVPAWYRDETKQSIWAGPAGWIWELFRIPPSPALGEMPS